MGAIYTGSGYWSVGWWILFAALALAMTIYFRSLGRGDYKVGTEQEEFFNAGHPVPEDPREYRFPAASTYWGFTRALSRYYDFLFAFHTGFLQDYVALTAGVLALFGVLALLV